MDKLNKLTQRCKCGVYLSINEHRNYYETVEEHIKSSFITEDFSESIDKGIYEKMKELNVIIELQFYPDTPIGFYTVYHYDLEMALDKALIILNIK